MPLPPPHAVLLHQPPSIVFFPINPTPPLSTPSPCSAPLQSQSHSPASMAASGFEGFEKRLELAFAGVPAAGLGLRRLDFESLQQILRAVQCTVVSAVANAHFDAYVLSESSLFVYPARLVIKTCGTTRLLHSLRPFLRHAAALGLRLSGCTYSRGAFIFPGAQPFPHTAFDDEVAFLDRALPARLRRRKAAVMPSGVPSHSWHVFSAGDGSASLPADDSYTVEVCMTGLDPVVARKFYRREGGGDVGKEMTRAAGIGGINRRALVCDVAFDPCGYSMNGVDGDRYSTIHVTPEDGYSYASFECVGSVHDDGDGDLGQVLRKAVQVFRPATVTAAVTTAGGGVSTARIERALRPLGLACRSCAVDQFPAAGTIAFLLFTARRELETRRNLTPAAR